MKLYTFLAERNLSAAEFGRMIGVDSRSSVCRYIRGERLPRPAVMRRIAEVTGGAVTAADFYQQPASDPRQPAEARA